MSLQQHNHGRAVDTELDESCAVYPLRLEPNFRPDFEIEHHRRRRWYDEPHAIFRWWMLAAVVAVCFGIYKALA